VDLPDKQSDSDGERERERERERDGMWIRLQARGKMGNKI